MFFGMMQVCSKNRGACVRYEKCDGGGSPQELGKDCSKLATFMEPSVSHMGGNMHTNEKAMRHWPGMRDLSIDEKWCTWERGSVEEYCM
jgi:hypothetical protein